jgi:hypothetical protein
VHAEPERIRTARALLDEYEDLWRHRVSTMDRLLAEPTDATKE